MTRGRPAIVVAMSLLTVTSCFVAFVVYVSFFHTILRKSPAIAVR